MKVYTLDNAVFVIMMYSSKVPLKEGEKHCPFCDGYAIKPVPRERGDKTPQLHIDCACGTGKA